MLALVHPNRSMSLVRFALENIQPTAPSRSSIAYSRMSTMSRDIPSTGTLEMLASFVTIGPQHAVAVHDNSLRVAAGDDTGHVYVMKLVDGQDMRSEFEHQGVTEELSLEEMESQELPPALVVSQKPMKISTNDVIKVTFENNGNEAELLCKPVIPLSLGDDDIAEMHVDIINALGLTKPKPLLFTFGGAGGLHNMLMPNLQEFINIAVEVANSLDSRILDGGTDSGVMRMVGLGVSMLGKSQDLIGVSPSGLVEYPGQTDPAPDGCALQANHSHFVLANSSEWGGETSTMFDLLQAFRSTWNNSYMPSCVLIANGGQISKKEVWYASKHGLPIIVFDGTGRLANTISSMVRQNRKEEKQRKKQSAFEVISNGLRDYFNRKDTDGALLPSPNNINNNNNNDNNNNEIESQFDTSRVSMNVSSVDEEEDTSIDEQLEYILNNGIFIVYNLGRSPAELGEIVRKLLTCKSRAEMKKVTMSYYDLY
eukprot:TRINITY_DN993_c1_g4_i2.p1 TRINITY_DN993_c1_g4~~TRINITY_DN993_c1_g4_i2.p1  ORF type:complete len:561 (-),score=171.51 TRINITY_DN993_c1_g4_i2:163-1611(-)